MKEIVQSKWRFSNKFHKSDTPMFLRKLGIDYREVKDQDFWEANAHIVRDLYEQMQEEVRTRMHELHPDRNNNSPESNAEFANFLNVYKKIKRAFSRHLPIELQESVPSNVIFTPIAEVRLARKAAQARERRKKNRVKFRAYRKAYYHQQKALGKIDHAKHKEAVYRWRKRHRRKVTNMNKKYREAHPEKVEQWKENYKASAARRGVKRKYIAETETNSKRLMPGTPEHEKRRLWRNARRAKNAKRVTALQREKRKLARTARHPSTIGYVAKASSVPTS